ncbi:carboxypeptidase-like regulatory domain-containing protein [Micromonospora sp. NPDC049801]|uniref:carboxypeptidase-like regulatory domain-containing protein n=1 Tax=unclassified Micromonospora TaxID=2617518 RepID=UPI0033C16382
MSTHRRAWKQRAGVVAALVAGALLAVPATPAMAADVEVSPGSVTVNAGSDATITVRITGGDNDESAKVSLSGLPSGVSCASGCGDVKLSGGGLGGPKGSVLVRIAANDNAGDATTNITVAVEAASGPDTANVSLTVKGKAASPPPPQQNQTVKSVSGKVVKKADGEPVPNAFVLLQDTAGHRYDAVADGSGNFKFTGSSQSPITPGRIDLGASSENIKAFKSFTANAGQTITGQRITLEIKVEVTPSATPSPTADATPTDEATEEGAEDQPSEEASPGAPANASKEDDGGGFGSYLIILLGGLLVAAGVGTIVLLWMKRRESGDDDDEPAAAGAAGAGGAVPAARGAFRGADDQTRVVNRPGGAPDPTMVGGAALSEAPTMMHRPVVDDVPPDPYGAPAQPYGAAGQQGWGGTGYDDEPGQGGYGGYGNAPASGGGYGTGATPDGGYGGGADGYGAAPGSGAGYGGATAPDGGYGGAPSSGSGYGSRDYTAPAGAGGYPPAPAGGAAGGYGERFDEPTGRYTGDSTQYPAPADPYATGVYQPEQGQGYGQPDPTAPYGGGRGAEPTGGYGQQTNAYDQGGYGQEPPQQRGGYDDRGYDQGGYGQTGGGYDQGGYGQEPPQQRGSYDDRGYDQGGYGQQQQGGRARPDSPPPTERGGRRLDWLDD